MKTATKCLFGGALVCAGVCTNGQASTVNFSGELDVTNVTSYGGNAPYFTTGGTVEVDTFSFTVVTGGLVTIDALSWQNAETFFDPTLFLFDGFGNLLTSNDDSGFDNNGSVSVLDSYISIGLAAGDYTVAIGAFYLTAADVANGFNISYVWGQTGHATSGAYQVDITGDDISINVVPIPPAAFGGLAMLAGLGAYRRVRR